jgi:hypothetical protein
MFANFPKKVLACLNLLRFGQKRSPMARHAICTVADEAAKHIATATSLRRYQDMSQAIKDFLLSVGVTLFAVLLSGVMLTLRP